MRLSDMLFKTPSSTELTGEFNFVYITKVVSIKQEQIFSITTFFDTDQIYQRLVFKKKEAQLKTFYHLPSLKNAHKDNTDKQQPNPCNYLIILPIVAAEQL